MNEYQHGGTRAGSGRKPVHEGPTKVIRVPEARVLEIRQYLDQVKNQPAMILLRLLPLKPERIMRFQLPCKRWLQVSLPPPRTISTRPWIWMNSCSRTSKPRLSLRWNRCLCAMPGLI